MVIPMGFPLTGGFMKRLNQFAFTPQLAVYMDIIFGADHLGFKLKLILVTFFSSYKKYYNESFVEHLGKRENSRSKK
jgi:hypothetical protein